MSASQLAIFSNCILGIFDLTMFFLIVTSYSRNPIFSRIEARLIKIVFAVIFAAEGGRHLYLAWREVYGYMTPSQDTPIAIVLNLVQVAVIPIALYIGWRIKRDLLWRRGDRE